MTHKPIIICDNSEEFIQRIYKENLWTREYTLRAITEYKKFISLGIIQPVDPSREIDVVWHTHLLYTKDYQKMCDNLGISFFHHNPKSEKEKKASVGKTNYQLTKELYTTTFRHFPPPDIWTNWKSTNYVNIDLNQHWVLKAGDWKTLLKLLFKFIKSNL